jgi:hypothetical protein
MGASRLGREGEAALRRGVGRAPAQLRHTREVLGLARKARALHGLGHRIQRMPQNGKKRKCIYGSPP